MLVRHIKTGIPGMMEGLDPGGMNKVEVIYDDMRDTHELKELEVKINGAWVPLVKAVRDRDVIPVIGTLKLVFPSNDTDRLNGWVM